MASNAKQIGVDMTKGSIFVHILRFAMPLLLANLVQQLYNSVDMMIVGKVVGSVGTVGVSTGGEIANLVTFFGMSFGSATQIYTAQMVGGGQNHKIREMGTTVLLFMMAVSMVFMFLCLGCTESLLDWLNCPSEAREQARQYMSIVAFGLPGVFGYNIVSGIMRGMGESKRPLLFVSIAAVANVLLDLLLVVKIPMEAAGSAIATVVSQFASFAAAFWCIQRSEPGGFFQLDKTHFRIQRKYLMPLLRIGVPITVQSTCIHFSQLICVSWVNSFGMAAASANSIGTKINRFIGVMTNSINGAGGSIVGQNLGAREHERVKKTVYAALAMGSMICVLEFVVALLLPEQLFGLFTDDPAVIRMGRPYLMISLITFFLNTLQGPYTSVITGSGNAKLSFLYGILDGIVLRLGISYILAFMLEMGVIGYWYGNALAHLGPVVIGIVYFYSGKWKTYRFLKNNE